VYGGATLGYVSRNYEVTGENGSTRSLKLICGAKFAGYIGNRFGIHCTLNTVRSSQLCGLRQEEHK
jgi:hypothetical protein